MASEQLHEQQSALRPETLERHRAITSLMEELEAVDWYGQRIDASQDLELRRILQHNRDEELEHASMLIEWLRRHDDVFAGHLRNILGSDRPLGEEGGPDEEGRGDGQEGDAKA